MLTVQEAVDNGIQWLDANYDGDWRAHINPGRLEMEDAFHCILGQLYGSYWSAPDGIRGILMGTNGRRSDTFYCCEMCDGEPDGPTYSELKDEWTRRLSE